MALVRTHFPEMSGERVGVTGRSETGAEKRSEIVVLAATFWAPGAGLVVFT